MLELYLIQEISVLQMAHSNQSHRGWNTEISKGFIHVIQIGVAHNHPLVCRLD
jgi:hypothetical protein